LADKVHHGRWSLPNCEDSVPGTLDCTNQGRPRLIVHCDAGIGEWGLHVPRILGRELSGELVTLEDSLRVERHGMDTPFVALYEPADK